MAVESRRSSVHSRDGGLRVGQAGVRVRNSAFVIRFGAFLLVLGSCFSAFPLSARAGQQPISVEPSTCKWDAALFGPPNEDLPQGISLFYLDDAAVSEPRLATLAFDKTRQRQMVRIFKCGPGRLETVFTLEEPEPLDWQVTELESFPSNGLVPGVVVWGSSDYTRTHLIVVCYTGSYTWLPSGKRVENKGTFKVAFEGDEAELVDLDLDGIPEVIAKMDSPAPEVWTYMGGAYVMVGTFPLDRLRSEDVRRAIEALKKKRTPGGIGPEKKQ